ncbi:MAG: class I SAM-dependent methyltransferase [Candidatus Delongbacteria bacterium]|nr:class I SAM-dependent methyltransferase [Candidatus Delongbacteria bacterium]
MVTEEYGVGDFIYDPQIYDKLNNFDGDLNFYYELAEEHNEGVLELCCGTGRLTIPLKEKGINIAGLDFTESMLDSAKEKARKHGLDIDFTLGDMRDFDLEQKFSMIFIPFNSLQNTYSVEDVSRVFSSVAKHLKDDGIFVFDIFNPSIHLMIGREKEFVEINRFTLDGGEEVILSEKTKYDSATQTLRCIWRHKIGEKIIDQKLDMRCYYPLEADMMVRYNNFEILNKYGDFDKSGFRSESMKQIYVCKKNRKKSLL